MTITTVILILSTYKNILIIKSIIYICILKFLVDYYYIDSNRKISKKIINLKVTI